MAAYCVNAAVLDDRRGGYYEGPIAAGMVFWWRPDGYEPMRVRVENVVGEYDRRVIISMVAGPGWWQGMEPEVTFRDEARPVGGPY